MRLKATAFMSRYKIVKIVKNDRIHESLPLESVDSPLSNGSKNVKNGSLEIEIRSLFVGTFESGAIFVKVRER